MKYRFYGDKLQLVKYVITIEQDKELYADTDIDEIPPIIYTAATDEEKDALLERYTNATVTEVDNSGYEYLEGEIFTQEQLANGELEAAIAMGEEAYKAMKNAPTQDEINAMLLLQNAQLQAEINELKAGGDSE